MATPSELSIANAALVMLGERRITSFDEETKPARILKERFDAIRDTLLRESEWNFAVARTTLPADTEAPSWGFAYAYSIPEDCDRVIEVYDPDLHGWKLEGRKIVTDIAAPIKLRYVRSIEDATEMDSTFREALSARLALELCDAITGSAEKVAIAARMLEKAMHTARGVDGQETTPVVEEWQSEFIDARF